MSSRRGGPSGRKSKANKAKQSKGNDSALTSGQLLADDYHNSDLPCCRLLAEAVNDLVTIDEKSNSSPSHQQQNQQRPTTRLLGNLIRSHLLDQRQRQYQQKVEGSSPNPSTPSKKKKKKKKKKGTNKFAASDAAVGTTSSETEDKSSSKILQETDETDSTVALSSTVSQDSQSISASVSKEEPPKPKNNNNSSGPAAAEPALCTPPRRTGSNQSPTNGGQPGGEHTSSLLSSSSPIPFVANVLDGFLDRLVSRQQQETPENETTEREDSSSDFVPSKQARDLKSFVQFLNERQYDTGTTATKQTAAAGGGARAGSGRSWLSITQQELERACQSIQCMPCRESALQFLKEKHRQPVVLSTISFAGDRSSAKDSSSSHARAMGRSNSQNHNGLAVPIHNQKPGAMPPPNVDFDYVAMEEGTNPMGMLMEAKADLDGIPYFHPQQQQEQQQEQKIAESTAASQPSSKGNTNSINNSIGSSNKVKGTRGEDHGAKECQVEWKFVSSSSATTSSLTTRTTTSTCRADANPQDTRDDDTATDNVDATSSPSLAITVQDLEHVVKNVMMPLGLPPDELVGAYTLTDHELRLVLDKVQRLEGATVNNVRAASQEAQKYLRELNELKESDNNEDNMNLNGTKYHELDDSIQKLLHEVVWDVILDRPLCVGVSDEQDSFVRTSPAWGIAVAVLTDACTDVLAGIMEALEDFERSLGKIANSQGAIPAAYLSLPHRRSYRTLLETKLRLILKLIERVRLACDGSEDAWLINMGTAGNSAEPSQNYTQQQQGVGVSGISLPFRIKWYGEQEFYRKVQERTRQIESAPASVKSSSSPSKNQESIEVVQTESTSVFPNESVGGVRLETLDRFRSDLLQCLVNFVQTFIHGRITEIWEEHMMRCQRSLGLLQKVGEIVFAPLVDTDKDSNCSKGFTLKDDELRMQCKALWTQIQQQGDQQRQLLMRPGEEEVSVEEQRRTVVKLMLASIELLKNLRKCVTGSRFEPTRAPAVMPLKLIKELQSAVPRNEYSNPEMFDGCYQSLISGTVMQERRAVLSDSRTHCVGAGGGQRRFISILLALFYRKLSEQCSEWHAELAKQELLTTMGDFNTGSEGASGQAGIVIGDHISVGQNDDTAGRNGANSSIPNTTSALKSKKSKKRRDKKAVSSVGNSTEATVAKRCQEEEKTNKGANLDDLSELPVTNGIADQDTMKSMNGHSQLPSETNSFTGTSVEENRAAANGGAASLSATDSAKTSNDSNNGLEETAVERDKLTASKSSERFTNTANTALAIREVSTDQVDKRLGVVDPSGAFQSAEIYLVGRLTALLHGATSSTSSSGSLKTNRNNAEGSAGSTVVII